MHLPWNRLSALWAVLSVTVPVLQRVLVQLEEKTRKPKMRAEHVSVYQRSVPNL